MAVESGSRKGAFVAANRLTCLVHEIIWNEMRSYRFGSIDFVCVVFKICFLGCLSSERVYTDLPLHLQNGKILQVKASKK